MSARVHSQLKRWLRVYSVYVGWGADSEFWYSGPIVSIWIKDICWNKIGVGCGAVLGRFWGGDSGKYGSSIRECKET